MEAKYFEKVKEFKILDEQINEAQQENATLQMEYKMVLKKEAALRESIMSILKLKTSLLSDIKDLNRHLSLEYLRIKSDRQEHNLVLSRYDNMMNNMESVFCNITAMNIKLDQLRIKDMKKEINRLTELSRNYGLKKHNKKVDITSEKIIVEKFTTKVSNKDTNKSVLSDEIQCKSNQLPFEERVAELKQPIVEKYENSCRIIHETPKSYTGNKKYHDLNSVENFGFHPNLLSKMASKKSNDSHMSILQIPQFKQSLKNENFCQQTLKFNKPVVDIPFGFKFYESKIPSQLSNFISFSEDNVSIANTFAVSGKKTHTLHNFNFDHLKISNTNSTSNDIDEVSHSHKGNKKIASIRDCFPKTPIFERQSPLTSVSCRLDKMINVGSDNNEKQSFVFRNIDSNKNQKSEYNKHYEYSPSEKNLPDLNSSFELSDLKALNEYCDMIERMNNDGRFSTIGSCSIKEKSEKSNLMCSVTVKSFSQKNESSVLEDKNCSFCSSEDSFSTCTFFNSNGKNSSPIDIYQKENEGNNYLYNLNNDNFENISSDNSTEEYSHSASTVIELKKMIKVTVKKQSIKNNLGFGEMDDYYSFVEGIGNNSSHVNGVGVVREKGDQNYDAAHCVGCYKSTNIFDVCTKTYSASRDFSMLTIEGQWKPTLEDT